MRDEFRRRKFIILYTDKFRLIIAVIAVLAATASVVIRGSSMYLEYKEKQESLVYEKQLASLNDIEKSINTLGKFVRDQKKTLKASRTAVAELQQEHQKLRPVVEADRKVIDALFQLQAEKQQKSIWLDRALGFFLGIASSSIASLLVMRVRRKKQEDTP